MSWLVQYLSKCFETGPKRRCAGPEQYYLKFKEIQRMGMLTRGIPLSKAII